ncbi:hypothetical protein D1007_55519 [Hordeum vulgare]|nr:hypothetical protein D1007_55519 [Hordeum vulgare]
MVFEDERSDSNLSLRYMYSPSSTDVLNQVPFSIEEPDYNGLELDLMVLCEKQDKASRRIVAFEGTYIGRRFLACSQPEDENCGFVEWVDHQQPPTMQNALLLLWKMYEDSKSVRVNDNLENALMIHHLTEERKKTLDGNYDKKVEMEKKEAHHKKLEEKYQLLVNLTRAQATAIQNLKLKHMKEKEFINEGRIKLEFQNAELTKNEEKLTQEKVDLKLEVADLLKGK